MAESCCFEHFIVFPHYQYFQKTSTADRQKPELVWEIVPFRDKKLDYLKQFEGPFGKQTCF